MQLKIKINVSKEPITPPEPAPFDPVKIRNFLLLIITLLSLIGFGVYSLWTKEPEPSLPSTVNAPNNVLSSKTVVNDTDSNNNNVNTAESNSAPINTTNFASSTQAEDTMANTINSTTANAATNAVSDTVSDAINAETLQNDITNKKAVVQPQKTNTARETNTINNNTTKTSATETTLAITSNLSAQETNKTEPELAAKTQPETQSPVNLTPKIVNNVEQKEADVLASTQTINNGVYRAQLTSNIIDREPIDNIEHLSLQKHSKLYFFTEIHGKNNQKIYHRWIFKKKRLAEITLNIRNDQWRTYSSKNVDETMIGQWEVQVVDQDDNILKTVMFEVSR
ncbi:DUF2914 domain-containing protein [Colwellia sp. UCD-KL20]|uniref:DUF2914 domain-containing protein n=1 Tax=Colwellia sp. UCD-KL20 TaxID=1917165 RepID=UPI000970B263|nr:DUF2914 domain-containing protein [Colwellia sp. UCD-KL20]